MNKELQTKLQNHFKNNDSLTLYKKDGSPKVFSKKYSIVFNSKYESLNFSDYDNFIEFAHKYGFTFTANKNDKNLTIDAVLKILKKQERVDIYSSKNEQCFVMLAPYIQCDNMMFNINCIDLCGYCDMTGLSLQKNNTITEEK